MPLASRPALASMAAPPTLAGHGTSIGATLRLGTVIGQAPRHRTMTRCAAREGRMLDDRHRVRRKPDAVTGGAGAGHTARGSSASSR
jgi:hypothetical protein